MKKKILSAKADFIFKLIFGNPRNVDILAAFLMAVLDLPGEEYESLTIADPHLRRESEDDKLGILDVRLTTKSGISIDIEIQILPLPHMRGRVVYYTSKMVTEQVASGDKYSAVKRVVSIIITDHTLIDDGEYHHCFRLVDKKTGVEFTDLIEADTLELTKLPEVPDGTELWAWLSFLKSEDEEELKVIAQRSPELNKAVGVLMELSDDRQTQLLYEARQKAWRDEVDRMEGASNNRAIEIAKKLLRRNRPLDEIIEDTALSRVEIESIAHSESVRSV